MVDEPRAPPGRRRVRTGCLTCRRRRRKCDEGKPTCENCQTKNFACRYGLNVTFVESNSRRAFKPAAGATVDYPNTPSGAVATPAAASEDDNPDSGQLISYENGHPVPNDVVSSSPVHAGVEFSHFQVPAIDQALTFSSPPSQHGQHANSSSHLKPWSPALSLNPFLDTWGPSPASGSGLNGPREAQDRYETDILVYYRYHVAPRLDLGVGDAYFGIRVPHRAKNCPRLYYAMLALSCTQQAATGTAEREVDRLMAQRFSAQAHENTYQVDDEDHCAVAALLTLLDMIQTPPKLWGAGSQRYLKTLPDVMMLEGPLNLTARLLLATRIMASPMIPSVDLSPVIQGTGSIVPSQRLNHKEQLRQVLSCLARALLITPNDSQRSQNTTLPFNSMWQSCWSDNQLWYSARNEEMQQILEVDEQQQHETDQSSFPTIIFSNNCALEANVVHHLTALYLLQHKPRLIRALAEIGSSSSPVWHVQRLIGIITSSGEEDILDPLLVASVIYAARMLSHPTQLSVVVEILRKASQTTGMVLQQEIETIEAGHSIAARAG